MKKVLVLMTNGVEETEAIAPIDLLQRAGTQITLASVAPAGTQITGRSNITLVAGTSLENLLAEKSFPQIASDFDALFLPGGPSTWTLLKNSAVIEIIKVFAAQNKLIAAICAAPLLLQAAGLIAAGTRISAHSCTWEEIPQAKFSAPFELDGNLLTSRGAGTAIVFGLEFVRALHGNAIAQKIAGEIMM